VKLAITKVSLLKGSRIEAYPQVPRRNSGSQRALYEPVALALRRAVAKAVACVDDLLVRGEESVSGNASGSVTSDLPSSAMTNGTCEDLVKALGSGSAIAYIS